MGSNDIGIIVGILGFFIAIGIVLPFIYHDLGYSYNGASAEKINDFNNDAIRSVGNSESASGIKHQGSLTGQMLSYDDCKTHTFYYWSKENPNHVFTNLDYDCHALYEDIASPYRLTSGNGTLDAVSVIAGIFNVVFWGFGILPFWLNMIFMVLRITLVITIARNIWIGGGG